MIEIGQALKEKRVALGVTLEQLEQQTKIRRKYLEAIEDGDWSVLPGDVYARGFVRSYAEAVGLDGQELLSRLGPKEPVSPAPPASPVQPEKGAQTRGPAARPAQPVARQRAAAPRTRRAAGRTSKPVNSRGGRGRRGAGVNGGQVAVVVGVLILLGAGWWALGRPHGANPAAKPGNQAGSQNLVSDNQTGNSVGNTAGNSSATGNNSTAAPPPAPQVTVTASPQPNGDVAYTVTAPAAQPLSATLKTTTAQCWVSVTKDGHLLSAGGQTLNVNSSASWTANNQLVIRVGNLVGVSLTLNGQAVTLPNVNHPINVTISKKSQ